MPSLREIQTEFHRSVSLDDASIPAWVVAPRNANPQDAMSIYRGNTTEAKKLALKAIYPVVARLVGDDFFDAMSLEYVRTHTSTSGDLNHYGDELSRFIATFPPAMALPYLASVAQIEWLVHLVYLEKDDEQRAMAFLSGVSPGAYGSVQFRLAYACRLLEMDWPGDDIWRAHQQPGESMGELVINKGRYYALVTRNDGAVHVRRINTTEFEFLRGIQHKLTLGDLVERISELGIDVDLGALLQQFVGDNTIVDGWLATNTV